MQWLRNAFIGLIVLIIGVNLALAGCQQQATGIQQTIPNKMTEFPVPNSQGGLGGITAGPDGNLWFTEQWRSRIGRITPQGKITEFLAGNQPWGITTGPDGNLWFTEYGSNQIGRMTLAGAVTEFAVPTDGAPTDITVGPDGNLWFTENEGSQIGRITPAGTIMMFPLPTTSYFPQDITEGPDGALWFTLDSSQIGRMTLQGAFTAFAVPPFQDIYGRTDPDHPWGITIGPTASSGLAGKLTSDGSRPRGPS